MVALYEVPGTNTCSVPEHLEILQAIETGDYSGAERLMDEHLLNVEANLSFERKLPSNDISMALS